MTQQGGQSRARARDLEHTYCLSCYCQGCSVGAWAPQLRKFEEFRYLQHTAMSGIGRSLWRCRIHELLIHLYVKRHISQLSNLLVPIIAWGGVNCMRRHI